MPSILFIVPSELSALQKKGVDHMILERDENGFFSKVITVHPFTRAQRTIELDDVHTVIEYGPFVASSSRWVRILQAPLVLIRLLFELPSFVREHKISVIRANDPYWSGLLGWWTSAVTGVPYCISIHADYDVRHRLDPIHGAPKFFGFRGPAEAIARFVFARAKLIMPIRESLGEYAIRRGADRHLIHVIPHGIDMTPFEARESRFASAHSIPATRKILSFAGRLSDENYVSDLVDLAEKLSRKRNDFCLVIAGGGPLENALRDRASMLGDAVRLTGFVSADEVRDLRKGSLVSLCLMGGFSLIEACAAGSPVIAYDIEWHSELVRNGETGFLVPEGNLDEVMTAVERLLDHPDLARSMGENARKLAFDRHSLPNTSAIKRAAYEKVMAS